MTLTKNSTSNSSLSMSLLSSRSLWLYPVTCPRDTDGDHQVPSCSDSVFRDAFRLKKGCFYLDILSRGWGWGHNAAISINPADFLKSFPTLRPLHHFCWQTSENALYNCIVQYSTADCVAGDLRQWRLGDFWVLYCTVLYCTVL